MCVFSSFTIWKIEVLIENRIETKTREQLKQHNKTNSFEKRWKKKKCKIIALNKIQIRIVYLNILFFNLIK